jgi:2-polyprenyl-3-methyl-5-hydroxy-6-metoxy-1,4-benzoquinol methylase
MSDDSTETSKSVLRLVNKWLMPLVPLVPIPHRIVRGMLLRDNASEHEQSGWARLRKVTELGRYSVIQGWCQHFAKDGDLLDVGSGEGILQEHLSGYRSYTGIDLFPESIAKASAKADARTRFVQADATTYVPEKQFDVIIWNECLYYLENPIDTITRYCNYLTPSGVMIVSMFYQTYATRRLFKQLKVLAPVVADLRVTNDEGASWVLRAYRPHASASASKAQRTPVASAHAP